MNLNLPLPHLPINLRHISLGRGDSPYLTHPPLPPPPPPQWLNGFGVTGGQIILGNIFSFTRNFCLPESGPLTRQRPRTFFNHSDSHCRLGIGPSASDQSCVREYGIESHWGDRHSKEKHGRGSEARSPDPGPILVSGLVLNSPAPTGTTSLQEPPTGKTGTERRTPAVATVPGMDPVTDPATEATSTTLFLTIRYSPGAGPDRSPAQALPEQAVTLALLTEV